jgi:hypothetical protein
MDHRWSVLPPGRDNRRMEIEFLRRAHQLHHQSRVRHDFRQDSSIEITLEPSTASHRRQTLLRICVCSSAPRLYDPTNANATATDSREAVSRIQTGVERDLLVTTPEWQGLPRYQSHRRHSLQTYTMHPQNPIVLELLGVPISWYLRCRLHPQHQ